MDRDKNKHQNPLICHSGLSPRRSWVDPESREIFLVKIIFNLKCDLANESSPGSQVPRSSLGQAPLPGMTILLYIYIVPQNRPCRPENPRAVLF